MKNLFFLLISLFSIVNVWSQNAFQLAPSPKLEATSSYNYVPQADDDLILTWLTSETMVNGYGFNSGGGVLAAYMELLPGDIMNFNATEKRALTIRQVQFYIPADQVANLTAANVSIRQGTSLAASIEVINQPVTVTGGWNNVDLNTEYEIDISQSIYIGYQVTIAQTGGFPLAVATGSATKQGWIYSAGQTDNIASAGYVFMIKAVAKGVNSPANALIISSLNIQDSKLAGEKLSIEGTVKNLGPANLTSFTLEYHVNTLEYPTNGADPVSYNFTGLNIAPNAAYNFKHPDSLLISEAKTYSISVTAKNPNGDENFSHSKSINTQGLAYIVPRVLLHESYTSSTCGPCKAGNANLKTVLNSVDENQWANIRYQMNWPSTGDPYYTLEGGVKRDLYGISSVPFLVVDGKWGNNSGSYTKTIFNQLAAIPSIVALSATAETDEKTVSAKITITPATAMNTENLYLFAAVVEKRTTKNKKSNGETEFLNVMKKFLTNVNGDPIENFETDVPQIVDLSYTFNGNYRLPANANSPINHAIEHSVEDFNNLLVVYWIQNMQSGVVLQAGKVDATFKTGLPSITQSNATAFIHDNSLYFRSKTPVQNVNLYNISGQKILTATSGKTIDVSHLNAGIYIVKLQTAEGEKVIKINK
ncbi:MAG: T9SS type A sorting domain-containing protein [Dysgonamonadaceae bacterium]|jgi:hypothetical protein|nr:T9SS type A sorting domain-containing protein [Dysgonamonadaceae bacterium]